MPTVSTPTLPPVRASAKGTDIEVSNVSAYPNRVQGKVVVQFNSDPNQIYDCSGTMVNSVQRNIVFTAGHCVYDHETSAYPSAMVFIPAYQNGMEPYGEFSAVSVNTTAGWVNTKSFSYDMGVVQLAGTPEDVIGSRGIAFDLNPVNRKFRIYGYPALPESDYDGERLIRCDAKFSGRDGDGGGGSLALPAGGGSLFMRQGASGGGWITVGNFVNSVTSYGYCDSAPRLLRIHFRALLLECGEVPLCTERSRSPTRCADRPLRQGSAEGRPRNAPFASSFSGTCTTP